MCMTYYNTRLRTILELDVLLNFHVFFFSKKKVQRKEYF